MPTRGSQEVFRRLAGDAHRLARRVLGSASDAQRVAGEALRRLSAEPLRGADVPVRLRRLTLEAAIAFRHSGPSRR
jgi:hypothetical protein